jgi:hypothetical protein
MGSLVDSAAGDDAQQEGESPRQVERHVRMSNRRYYVTLVFIFFVIAMVLGTISEVMQ